MLLGLAPVGDPGPTTQDLQIVGRVLSFQETPASGAVVLAIVYNPAEARSLKEANEIAALLGNGLAVGDLVLRPLLVEQAQLAGTTGYAAIFSTSDVDQILLASSLKTHHVPCVTRHLDQVEQGICTVAICVHPTISIVVSQGNATAAGVHFATAFRMMVREI